MISKNEWDVSFVHDFLNLILFKIQLNQIPKYSIEIGFWHFKSNLSLLRNWSRKKIGGFCTQCQASSILWRLLKKRHAKTNCLWIKWCSLFKSSKGLLSKALAQSIVKYVLHLPLITKYTKYIIPFWTSIEWMSNYFKMWHVTSLFFFYPLLNYI